MIISPRVYLMSIVLTCVGVATGAAALAGTAFIVAAVGFGSHQLSQQLQRSNHE